MPTAFRLVIALIAASPVLAFVDGRIAGGIVGAYVAVVAAFVAATMRPIEASHLAGLLRPFALGAAVPALWMIVQALPMPIKGLAHPIWQSAEQALGQPIFGKISIDPGGTIIALSRYLLAIGVIFVATAVSIDRRRAEQLQSWLAGVAAFVVVILIVRRLGVLPSIGGFIGTGPDVTVLLAAIGSIGIVMNCATLVRVLERNETRRIRNEVAFSKFGMAAAAWGAGTLICAIGVTLASIDAVFITACGLGILLLTVLIRRLGLGPWPSVAIASAAGIAAVALVASNWGSVKIDPALRFANAPPATVAIAQRMISDAPLAGTGAGTFAASLPTYRDIEDLGMGTAAPTTAAATTIELGWPAFWIIVAGAVFSAISLVRGALERGRDSFYPAAAAGCLIILVLEAFRDASLLQTSVVVIAAGVVGLGLAQTASRTAQ